VHAWPDDQQVHGSHRERAKTPDDAPVPDLRRQGHRRLHRSELRRNGYIWHTTGSGKTLTSFKASTLLKTNESIHKCLFVVDRKDLDRQTREEFNRFQENCVEENTNTAALVRRLQSDDYADKVIVTTIQKLGIALDENSKHNKQNIAQRRSTFKQRLEQHQDKRMVFIFDECHRSQFGETHKAIKEFFPNSQLFGFTGTPIFEDNAAVKQIEGDVATLRTTKDLFQKELHAYTITHAIEDRNVLRFHVDYYKPKDASALKPGQTLTKQAIAQAILDNHDAATGGRRFNALLATASINDAIEHYEVFKKLQAGRQAADPEFVPLKIAAVFSPPAEGNKDVQQIQEDLPQEKEDNRHDPEVKKTALKAIIADYNQRYGTNHDINNFDLYYQDVQQRIKDQQFPNRDLPRKGQEKIDMRHERRLVLHPALPLVRPRRQPARRRCGAADARHAIVRGWLSKAKDAAKHDVATAIPTMTRRSEGEIRTEGRRSRALRRD
jgi:type I restriction enzyme, R subunit